MFKFIYECMVMMWLFPQFCMIQSRNLSPKFIVFNATFRCEWNHLMQHSNSKLEIQMVFSSLVGLYEARISLLIVTLVLGNLQFICGTWNSFSLVSVRFGKTFYDCDEMLVMRIQMDDHAIYSFKRDNTFSECFHFHWI